MINHLYTIKDLVADETGPIFEGKNDGVAIRNFIRGLKEADIIEFELLRVGKIDHDTGEIEPVKPVKVEIGEIKDLSQARTNNVGSIREPLKTTKRKG